MSLLLNPRDLEFLLYDWLQVEKLLSRSDFTEHSRETFDAALQTAQQIAEDEFYPINKALDADEPRVVDGQVVTPAALQRALRAFIDAGFMAAGQRFELGGMQLPQVIERACFAWFSAASAAASAYPMLTIGNLNVLLKFGTAEQIERFARPQLEGRFFGTMCLSEPQAGSSLSDIRTKAVPQADGSYRLFGNKMWISGGDHELSENIVHLVLAKVAEKDQPVAPGVKSISLFVVPKYLVNLVNNRAAVGERNDVSLAGLNHKMGYRGTTNCLLNFGEGSYQPKNGADQGQSGAVGWLVGELNQGLACMFHMMNEARIGVGMGAVTLGYAGYLHALAYARQRPQGRPIQAKDPSTPQTLIIEHADVKRMLLAQKSYVEGGMALELYCARLVDDWHSAETSELRQAAFERLELLTPVAKSWPSQWCLEANSLAIQVHGGYGYTRDYNVEQYYRDNRLNPIHEGAHGIQGLDLLARKVRMNQGQVVKELIATVLAVCDQAQVADSALLREYSAQLRHQTNALATTLAKLAQAPSVEIGLANASIFLEAFGHWVVGWLWLEQAQVATTKLTAIDSQTEYAQFLKGKLQAAQYFLRWELPKLNAQWQLLAQLDSTTLDMQNDWF